VTLDFTDPMVRSVITGIVTAAAVDFQAFRSWKSLDDARRYGWGVAAWRWLLGAVAGVVTGLGFGALQ
jgi:hypothetical protein